MRGHNMFSLGNKKNISELSLLLLLMRSSGQHCLLTGISMQNATKVRTSTRNPYNYKWTHPVNQEGHVHWSKKG